MNKYLPSLSEVSKQTILFVVATIAAALIISRFPSIKQYLKGE